MKTLEPTTMDFFDRAPMRISASAHLDVSPDHVFACFADPSRWVHWFPLMHRARWVSGGGGLGAEREVSLRLLGTYRERMIAWEPGARFAFTMVGSTSPLALQLAEDYRLVNEPNGTRLDWVMAAVPTKIGKVMRAPTTALMQRIFRRGGQRLNALLTAL